MVKKKKVDDSLLALAPHSIEAEKGVLSSMLQDQTVLNDCMGKVEAKDFFIPAHKLIFEEMHKDWQEGKPVDLLLITQAFIDSGKVLEIGGAIAITEIYNFVPSPVNYLHYVEILKEKTLARKLIELCNDGVKTIHEDPGQIKSILANIQSDIGLIRPWSIHEERTLKDDVLDKIARMETGEPDQDVVKTGITKLDLDSPIKKGDFPVISGETKSGKSITAITILENVCVKGKATGLYFSLESPRSEVVDRIFAGISKIPMDRHHAKFLNQFEMEKAMKAADIIGNANLIVHDDIYELSEIVSTIRHVKSQHPELALVVVDYCQLVQAPTKKGGTRQEEVAIISRTLRLVALETKVPVIMLSQENEQGQSRESRAILQDCTAWIKVERDVTDDIRKIRIPYQRNRASGISFDVTFLGAIGRVENYARDEDDK